MPPSSPALSPSQAAARLGVSPKALRLYEQRGLVTPARTAAGWRAYGPDAMARAADIVALRALGLSLTQVARVLDGDARDLAPVLARHQAALARQAGDLAATIARIGALRSDLAQGKAPDPADLAAILRPHADLQVAVDLPWPWGGERFVFRDIPALTYITGPLGSGKTRLARCLAEALPDAGFLGLDRVTDAGTATAEALDWLAEEGATLSDALRVLMAAIGAASPQALVIDMVEQGLDPASQQALIAYLRRRGPGGRKLIMLTRSSAILDLAAVGADEAIILCPANHSPPMRVAPYPGTPGYEAVATCLATPAVRARTAGVIAWRSDHQAL
ncbi:MerR family transcriptional regulator [Tistrella bauzanensis]|uniref:MerR family transcriptional regulator n=1 Tax=Tistrella TaxID=171436 RepID=UPI0031F67000